MMKTNIDLNVAIKQMRVARKLGRISNEVQSRVMRRLNPRPVVVHWERMMALRASIEKDLLPTLIANREADEFAFQIHYNPISQPSKILLNTRPSLKVRKPVLTGYENSPEWWKDAELRERANRKAGKVA